MIGRVPKGTVVKYSGKAKGEFLEVEVELTQGSVQGWIPLFAVPRRVREDAGVSDSQSSGPDTRPEIRRTEEDQLEESYRPIRRVKIPSDEGILIRREPSFFYGIQAGGGVALMSAPAVSSNFFMGPAIYTGAHVGYFLSRVVPIRFEVNYALMSGTEPTGKINPISIGFIQTGVSISYYLDQFELYGGASFGLGVSVNDIDPKIKIATPMDFSGAFFHAGIGYLFPLGDISNLAIRIRYDYGGNQSFVAPQAVSGLIYLEFRG